MATLRLAGNKFTGCIPESLQTIADNDIVSGGLWICGTEPPKPPKPKLPLRTGGGGGSSDSGGGDVTIIVANGWSPPDIGVAAALAARTPDSAVLYTHPDHVPAGVVNLLAGLSVARVVVVGGAAAVGEQTVQALTHAAKNARTDRVAGIDRVSTAVDAARSALSSAARSTIIVANGWSPPDIGVAAALAARTPDSAVLYTHLGMLADAVVALLRSEAPAVVRIVGGNAAVPAHIKDAIKAILPDGARVIRYSGPTRTSTAIAVARLSLQS